MRRLYHQLAILDRDRKDKLWPEHIRPHVGRQHGRSDVDHLASLWRTDFEAKRDARDLFTECADAHGGGVGKHDDTDVATGRDRKPAVVPGSHTIVPPGHAIPGNV